MKNPGSGGGPVAKSESKSLTKQQKRDKKRADAQRATKDNTIIAPVASAVTISKPSVSAYKREPIYPSKPILSNDVKALNRFLKPSDKAFSQVMSIAYPEFAVDPASQFSPSFHERFQRAIRGLETRGLYQFDFTQPGGLGTKVARTYVTRCLVGDPGITYKYLGLRMFSLPWRAGEIGASSDLVEIGSLNSDLIDRTEELLRTFPEKTAHGSARYNLTLINRCLPDDGSSGPVLKDEPLFGGERITVSWHADSSLQHYSSIGVYHFTVPKNQGTGAVVAEDESWRVALRVSPNAEGPLSGKKKSADNEDEYFAPPVAIPLKSGSVYYLLDEFNHHHQHSVLSGLTERYASTHRVSREDGHTFAYIRSKCLSALNEGGGASSKTIRSQQLCLVELEFEWIRQFYIQGQRHHDLHIWWHSALTTLLDLWLKLESVTFRNIQILLDAAESVAPSVSSAESAAALGEADRRQRKQILKRIKQQEAVTLQSYIELIGFLQEKVDKRNGWMLREKDPIFKTAALGCTPMSVPFPPINHALCSDAHPSSETSQKILRAFIAQLNSAREAFQKRGVPSPHRDRRNNIGK